MSTYAARSSYEFSESPKKSPMRASPTPTDPETPSKSAFSSFLSNKWGAFTTKASEVAQKARGRLHEIVQSSPSTPADNSYEGPDLAFAPWENLGTLDVSTAYEVKKLITELADNPRHLLNTPPTEATFNFDDWLPVALTALRQDERLRKCRLALVPKDLDEEGFWCNYFFRVNTIKKAYGLSEVPQLKEGVSAPAPSVLRSSLSSSGSSVGKRDVDPAEVDFTYIAPTAPGEPNLVGLMAPDETESDSLSDSDDSSSLPFESLQPTEAPLLPSPAPFIDLETAGT